MQSPNAILVSVEINNAASSLANSAVLSATNAIGSSGAGGSANVSLNSSLLSSVGDHHNISSASSQHSTNTVVAGPSTMRASLIENAPIPSTVDNLRSQMHSRQASSSSNNSSSLLNLGSPKPEKRQANSPLPPTPKSNVSSNSQLQALSSSNLTSGRNSVISVIECNEETEFSEAMREALEQQHDAAAGSSNTSPQRRNKSLSPSKDIEGMYAKVSKCCRNKLQFLN